MRPERHFADKQTEELYANNERAPGTIYINLHRYDVCVLARKYLHHNIANLRPKQNYYARQPNAAFRQMNFRCPSFSTRRRLFTLCVCKLLCNLGLAFLLRSGLLELTNSTQAMVPG